MYLQNVEAFNQLTSSLVSWENVSAQEFSIQEPTLRPKTQEDHEIFDLVTELEAAEGKGTTFYSWLEVPSTASTTEIAKAYRKKSMQLQ